MKLKIFSKNLTKKIEAHVEKQNKDFQQCILS
jgi:hypothetical protein